MTTYRAAYISTPKGGETVLTRPEHADMSDDELRAEALAEAQRGDIIDMEEADEALAYPRITRAQFDAWLQIGPWTQ